MKYDAFISYRHSELDMMVAKKIHKDLETFKIPRSLQKKIGKKNIKRVFRDQEELPIGSDLAENIRKALKETEFLIVICSPRSKKSYWVMKEIETFIEFHGRDHILAVLIEGEPDEAFPEMIMKNEKGDAVEPLAADLRERNPKKVRKKLKTEIMRLAAPILGCNYDDLRQRHRERKMRKAIMGISFIAVAAILFGIYSTYNVMLIKKNFREKQINQSKYMAEKSAELLEYGDRRSAALVALEAMPGLEEKRPYEASAELALSRALRCYDTGRKLDMDRILKHELPLKDFSINREGTMLASIDKGNGIYAWDIATGKKLLYVLPEIKDGGDVSMVCGAAITKEGNLFFARSNTVSLMKMDGTELWKNVIPGANEIINCVVDEEANLAICQNLQTINIVDLKNGQILDTIVNTTDFCFSSDMVLSEEKDAIAISHNVEKKEGETGLVSVYDFTTKQLRTVETSEDYIEEICFTEDNQIVTMSVDGDAYWNMHNRDKKYERVIEKVEIETGKSLWKHTIDMIDFSFDSPSNIMRAKSYKDKSTGEELEHIYIMVDKEIQTLDQKTGKMVSNLNFSENIVSMKLKPNSPLGFVTSKSGVLHVCDLTEGEIYNRSDINTEKMVADLAIQNGIVAIREILSPDITIMTYEEGNGMEELHTYDSYVETMSFSENDKYYVVEENGGSEGNIIHFYKTESDELVDTWIPDMDQAYDTGTFLDDKTYMIKGNEGTLGFFNVDRKKEKFLKVAEDIAPDYYVTANKEYALIESNSQYFVVDLKKRKVISKGKLEGVVYGFTLSEDGKKAAFHFGNKGFSEVDLTTNEVTDIELDGATIWSGQLDGFNMVYSPDGKYVAYTCVDNMLRIVDMETKKIIREISFYGGNCSFIGFIEDKSHILLQDDDHYIRVYDWESDHLVFASQEQYSKIKEMRMNEKGNTLNLTTENGMKILHAEDYQLIVDNEDLRLFSAEKEVVFCESNNTIYRFPYMDEEMLYKEVENQFPGETLSTEEKIRFNLE